MNNEPEYIFKKGEGWVIQTCETITVKMYCGTLVRLERRKPNPGELCIWHHYKTWDLNDWMNWARLHSFAVFGDYSHALQKGVERDWMTAIKL